MATFATLTSKGQTTLPKPVRDRLNLKAGDRLEFVFEDDGRVTLVPATLSVRGLKGLLPRPRRTASIADMKAAIRKRARR